jgi:hypothetical protein
VTDYLLSELARIADAAELGVSRTRIDADHYAASHGQDAAYPHLVGGLKQVIARAVEDVRALVNKIETGGGEDF